ncbi:MAG: ABC transporter permease, partial [Acidobacteriaceae bacterium]|nr:ABC transporter permease [Acidobacteriaceae bacterium]
MRLIRSILSRRSREENLEHEIQSHLRMAMADHLDRGETVAEARDAVRREFGNVGLVKETTRAMWSWTSLERLLQDARYAARVLRKSPAFTAVAVLSIALGVGANTAIFSVIDALMLRSLPVRNPNELLIVGDPTRVGSLSQGSGRTDTFSYPFYERFRERNQVFREVYASGRSQPLSVIVQSGESAAGPADEKPRGRLVSGNYFTMLGVPALIGRTFTEPEVRIPGSAPVVVISYGYWERQFARAREVIGQKLIVNGSTFTIVGVTPPGFFGDIVGLPTDIWMPITMQAQANPGHDYLKKPGASWLLIMGRLKPGVSEAQARAAVNVLAHQILKELFQPTASAEALQQLLKQPVAVSSGAKGFSRLRAEFSAPLMILMGIVGLVLLICCANVANLQLARATSRGREMGLRVAVGAGHLRLVRQLLTESMMLSLFGGGAGLLFAVWGSRLLLSLVTRTGPLPLAVHLDSSVLLFTGAVSVVAGLLFGLAPAWKTSRVDVIANLKESKSGQADKFARAFGRALIVSQIVFSLVLLVCAGMFIRTLQNLQNVDVGYARKGLLLVEIDPIGGGYDDARINEVTGELLRRFERLPGVEAVTVSENGLFSGTESASDIQIEASTARSLEDRTNSSDRVGPNYFEVVGTPVLQGRGIGAQDAENAPKVAVINERMARFYFPHDDALGKHIFNEDGKNRVAYTIVGVVRNAKQRDLRESPARRFYTAYLQHLTRDPIDIINFEIR